MATRVFVTTCFVVGATVSQVACTCAVAGHEDACSLDIPHSEQAVQLGQRETHCALLQQSTGLGRTSASNVDGGKKAGDASDSRDVPVPSGQSVEDTSQSDGASAHTGTGSQTEGQVVPRAKLFLKLPANSLIIEDKALPSESPLKKDGTIALAPHAVQHESLASKADTNADQSFVSDSRHTNAREKRGTASQEGALNVSSRVSMPRVSKSMRIGLQTSVIHHELPTAGTSTPISTASTLGSIPVLAISPSERTMPAKVEMNVTQKDLDVAVARAIIAAKKMDMEMEAESAKRTRRNLLALGASVVLPIAFLLVSNMHCGKGELKDMGVGTGTAEDSDDYWAGQRNVGKQRN